MNSKRTLLAGLTLVALLAGTFSLQSCKKDTTDPNPASTGPTYMVYGNNGNSAYMLGVDDLTKGTVSTVGNGADITKYEGIRAPNLIQKGGFLYWIESAVGKITKFKFENNTLVLIKAIPFTTPTGAVGAYKWLDDHTLFVGMYDHYATIDTDAMTITNSGSFPIPAQFDGYSADAFVISGGKLYLPYAYFIDGGNYTEPGVRLAVMDFPSMANVKLTQDARSTYPGGTNGSQQVIFDENGYIYVTCTNAFANPALKIHSAIMRIKVGETVFDPNYFFDLSSVANDTQLGLYYLGNGKAIVKSGASDFATPGDFYVVDVNAKTKTKLNLPGSGLSFRGNVLVEDGKAYILCDSDYYVYKYDPATGSITKGLKVEGINFFQSLYKLK